MTSTYTAPSEYGRWQRVDTSTEESVPQPPPPPADPPIYQALLRQWASHGRTLPGRRDPEWNRLAAAPVFADRTVRASGVSGTLVPRRDER